MARKVGLVLSHWYHLTEGLQDSPQRFYSSLEEAINGRQLPDISLSRVDYYEGGVFSAKREYLRVERKEHIFDVCAAPFGNGFFISWWLGKAESPFGTLALLGLIVTILVGITVSFQSFGFFWGLIFSFIGFPILFWLFVKLMNNVRPGWDDALVAMPLIGPLYERIFRPTTYYQFDSALMFQESVHLAVREVVDQITQAQGLRALSELEYKPIMKELLRR